MTAEVRELLIVARALVDRGWTQRVEALNGKGKPVWARNPQSVCWCLAGALDRAAYLLHQPDVLVDEIGHILAQKLGFDFEDLAEVVNWNDAPERTQAEVVALLDSLIAEGGVA